MSTSMSSFADGEEIVIPCSDGIKLAAKYWKPFPGTTGTAAAAEVPTHRIVCLHGWLDNAASFHLLAPAVHSRLSHGNDATSVTTPSPAVHVLALDLPGHGLSSHKSPDGPTSIMSEYALYLAEALTSLRWIPRPDDAPDPNPSPNPDPTPPITLIGHSMGTAVALIYAAAFPEHVRRVVLLEGLLLHRPAEDVSTHVRNAVRRRISSNPTSYHDGGGSAAPGNARPGNGVGRRYPTFAHAVALRRRAATVLPGNQSLSESAAGAIVSRSTTAVGDGSVRFRHDPRLHLPSLHYFTPGQVEAVYRDVRCPVCLLGAEEGFPPPSPGYLDAVERVLAPEVRERLEGSHHFHADPETAGAVVDEVVRFLE